MEILWTVINQWFAWLFFLVVLFSCSKKRKEKKNWKVKKLRAKWKCCLLMTSNQKRKKNKISYITHYCGSITKDFDEIYWKLYLFEVFFYCVTHCCITFSAKIFFSAVYIIFNIHLEIRFRYITLFVQYSVDHNYCRQNSRCFFFSYCFDRSFIYK
jgi:hypothetical protein